MSDRTSGLFVMSKRFLEMSDLNLESKVYWWVMTITGTAITAGSLISLRTLEGSDWLKLFFLLALILLSSKFPLRIPSADAAVSVSDVFVFLALFFLGTGPAIVLGVIDSL